MSIGGKKRDKKPTVVETDEGWKQDPHNPLKTDGVVENAPVVTKVQERRSVIDTEYTPIAHLIKHSSGDMWTVDYYRQLVGLDDQLRPLPGPGDTSHAQVACRTAKSKSLFPPRRQLSRGTPNTQ